MRRIGVFLGVGWVLVLVCVVAVPHLTKKIQPTIIEKVMWRIKEVNVIEEKIVYVPAKVGFFLFEQVTDDEYKLYTNDSSIKTWGIQAKKDHALIKIKRHESPNVASASSFVW